MSIITCLKVFKVDYIFVIFIQVKLLFLINDNWLGLHVHYTLTSTYGMLGLYQNQSGRLKLKEATASTTTTTYLPANRQPALIRIFYVISITADSILQ